MTTNPQWRRRCPFLALAFAAILMTTAACSSRGDEEGAGSFPSDNIEIVVPYPAGGPTDTVARSLAEALNNTGKLNGHRAVVSNLTGASGASAAIYLNGADPNGSTLGVFPMSVFTIATLLKDQPYSAEQVELLLNVGQGGNLILVPGDAPYDDFKDFCDAAAVAPGTFTVGNPGSANLSETQLRVLADATGCDYKVVNFEGAAPALTAMLGGDIDAYLAGSAGISGQVESGEIKAVLQIAGEPGSGFLADIPDVVSLLGTDVWARLETSAMSNNMVAVSDAVSEETKTELLALVTEAAESPEYQETVGGMGLDITLSDSAENEERVGAERDWYESTIPGLCDDGKSDEAPLCVAWAARPGA